MVFNATFNNISVISYGGRFYWWRKLGDRHNKVAELNQLTGFYVTIYFFFFRFIEIKMVPSQ
jgi:hypothetical protein